MQLKYSYADCNYTQRSKVGVSLWLKLVTLKFTVCVQLEQAVVLNLQLSLFRQSSPSLVKRNGKSMDRPELPQESLRCPHQLPSVELKL